MAPDIIRDAPIGDLVRIVTKNKVLSMPEHRDDFVWDQLAVKRTESSATLVHADHPEAKHSLADPEAHPEKIAPMEHAGLGGAAIEGEIDAEKKAAAATSSSSGSSTPPLPKHDKLLVTCDPANPQNWSLSKKVLVTVIFGAYTFSVYIASAIYTPGSGLLQDEFGATSTEATLGLTLFVFGYSISPLVLTPMTMLPSIGRRNVYIISFFFYLAFLIGSAGVRNLAGFLVFRLLCGLAGSPAISTVGVSLSDVWAPLKAPRALAIWGSFATLGPVLGPLIGAAAIERWPTWRSPLWILACITAGIFLMTLFFMPETAATTILHWRMDRLKKRLGREDIETDWQRSGMNVTIFGTIKMALKCALDPSIAYVCAQVALVYLILYCWFEVFPFVYGADGYNFTPVEQGLVYVAIGVGVFLTIVGYVSWLVFYFEPTVMKGGMRPEIFLPPGYVAVVALPVCLFFFGWTANRTHWIVPTIATVFFGPGAFLCFMSGLNYLAIAFPQAILAIFCLNAVARGCVAAFGPLYATPAIQHIGVAWWSSLLGFVSLFMIPLPFLLQFYGQRLRQRSKYATPEPEKDESAAPAAGA